MKPTVASGNTSEALEESGFGFTMGGLAAHATEQDSSWL